MATDTKTLTIVDVDLPAEIFDVQTNVPLIHQVVVAQLAAARQGTHSTKTRAEVRGGGRKPYRQKGTGRARQGSIRAPQFAGGGIVHGPTPRDYAQRTPKKMKAAALRGALSDRARHGRIHVVESLAAGDSPSAKAAAAGLASLTERKNLLVVLERTDSLSLKSVRNLGNVHVLVADQLNTYDVLCADDIVFTKGAYDAFVTGRGASSYAVTDGDEAVGSDQVTADDAPEVTYSVTDGDEAVGSDAGTEELTLAQHAVSDTDEAETAAQPAALVELPTGAAASLEDGNAPEGYDIKGNADSGLYHLPGGRWYDQTVAEFWFKTEDEAKAAGFTKAGTKKSEDDK